MLDSKQYSLWRRLARRFLLEDQPPSPIKAGVSKQIYLVSIADELLLTPKGTRTSKDIQASAGGYVDYFTVSPGKRWHIKQIHREATSANSQVQATIRGNLVHLFALGVANEGFVVSFILDEGDDLGLRTTGNAGDASREMSILFSEEDAF